MKPNIVLAWDNVQVGGEAYFFSGAPFCLKIEPGAKLTSMNVIAGETSGLIILSGAYLNETQRSSITLVSPGRYILSNTLGLETNCETNRSILTITWGPTTPEAVVIVPAGFCPGGQGDASVCFLSQEPIPPTPPTTQTFTTDGRIRVNPLLGGTTIYTNEVDQRLKMTLTIPPQAVSNETTFYISRSYAPSPLTILDNFFPVYPYLPIYLYALDFNGNYVTSFYRPLTLTVNYIDNEIKKQNIDEKTLTIYYFNGDTKSYSILLTSVNSEDNNATAYITNLPKDNFFGLAGKRTWVPPSGYEHITEPTELKFYKNIITEPGTNKKYGLPKIPNWKTLHPTIKDKILKSPYAAHYEYITGPWALRNYKHIITEPGGIKKYGIPKSVWTVPAGYEYIPMPDMISFYKKIIKQPGTNRLYGIRK